MYYSKAEQGAHEATKKRGDVIDDATRVNGLR